MSESCIGARYELLEVIPGHLCLVDVKRKHGDGEVDEGVICPFRFPVGGELGDFGGDV